MLGILKTVDDFRWVNAAGGYSIFRVLVWFGPGGRQSRAALCAVVASACLSLATSFL
jgi:hypothetical protein